MSRILFAPLPAAGHLRPLLPVAAELVRTGHDVLFLAADDFVEVIAATGAEVARMVHSFQTHGDVTMEDLFPDRPAKPGPKQLAFDMENAFINSIPGSVADLLPLVEQFRPDVLVGDFGSFALGVVAELTGTPLVAVGVSPLLGSSIDTAPFGLGLAPSSSVLGRLRNRTMNWLIRAVLLRGPQQAFNRVRESFGLDPVPYFFLDDSLRQADAYLQNTVPSFEYPRSDAPATLQFTGAAKQDAVDEWTPPAWWSDLTSARSVVLVTQGTAATESEKLILPTVQALADEDVLVVVAAGADPEVAVPPADRPANVRVERFIPFPKLLPFVDVMVTNGGYGGVQMALAAGVPLVVAGKSEDKTEVTARVGWSGVGINLKTNQPKPGAVRAAVREVLGGDRYRRRATELAAEFAEYDSTELQSAAILALAGTRHGDRDRAVVSSS